MHYYFFALNFAAYGALSAKCHSPTDSPSEMLFVCHRALRAALLFVLTLIRVVMMSYNRCLLTTIERVYFL